MSKLCECGCGEPVLRTTARFLRGHHWKIIREANGVPSFKVCEHCEQPYTKKSIGSQRTAHWLERRYCSDACRLAARAIDPEADRRCPMCERDLPPALFYATGGWCKDCARKAKRGTVTPEERRRANLWNAYRITPEEYEVMAEEQGGVCAICGQPEVVVDYRSGDLQRLAVDHCHDTKAVRALLCGGCNIGLGRFHHDAELLRAAADYVEAHTP